MSKIIAREIAFGPLGDNSSRSLGIYFNISAKDITLHTNKSKHRVLVGEQNCGHVKFPPESPFFITETLDNDAHMLIRDTLRHYVIHEKPSHDMNDYSIKVAQASLKSRFDTIMSNYSAWSWKSNANRYGPLDIPEVNAFYSFDYREERYLKTPKLWHSFITAMGNVSMIFALYFTALYFDRNGLFLFNSKGENGKEEEMLCRRPEISKSLEKSNSSSR